MHINVSFMLPVNIRNAADFGGVENGPTIPAVVCMLKAYFPGCKGGRVAV